MDGQNNAQTAKMAQIRSEQTASFTGHRNIRSAELPQLKERLDETIAELIGKNVVSFLVGGARGFDTLAAQAVLRAREKYSTVKLIMVLPCRDQDLKWTEAEKEEYKRLLEIANEVVCLSEQYYKGCMEKRNLYLIEHSSVCIAYMKRGRSGTSQTVRFARERGLTVINLAEN